MEKIFSFFFPFHIFPIIYFNNSYIGSPYKNILNGLKYDFIQFYSIITGILVKFICLIASG
jgi:hypothetical protein